jgi:hypothetical protein
MLHTGDGTISIAKLLDSTLSTQRKHEKIRLSSNGLSRHYIQLSDTEKLTKKIAKHRLERQPNRTVRAHKTAKQSMLHDISQNMRKEHQMIQQMEKHR